MKRSEALKIIDDAYGEFCADWLRVDLNDLEGFVALNERILSALEKAGMMPPEYIVDYCPLMTTYAWEKEDIPDKV